MKKIIIIIAIVGIVGWIGYSLYRIDQTYAYLEAKTIWCLEKGGTMIQAQCVKLERLDTLLISNY